MNFQRHHTMGVAADSATIPYYLWCGFLRLVCDEPVTKSATDDFFWWVQQHHTWKIIGEQMIGVLSSQLG